MPNVFEPDWDADRDDPPYKWRRSRLGKQAGSEKLGASLFEMPPGAASFPLHVHYANEELIVVISGRPTLRRLDGERERELEPGEVVACPTGDEGAHRLDNHTDEPVRVLIVSTMLAPEMNWFPETGEAWGRNYIPGTDPGPDSIDLHGKPD